MTAQARPGRLERAGFVVVEAPFGAGDVPSERNVWRRVVSSAVRPAHTVPYGEPRALEATWRRALHEGGVLPGGGAMLISLTRSGPDDGGGWALVRLPGRPLDLGSLGPYPHAPEFVALSIDGHAVCAVTAEEHELWISCMVLQDPVQTLQ